MTSNSEVVPDLFYKRSQEKNTSPVAGFFLGFQPTALSRIVLAFRSAISGRYAPLHSAFGFVCQRFSSVSARRSQSVRRPQAARLSRNRINKGVLHFSGKSVDQELRATDGL